MTKQLSPTKQKKALAIVAEWLGPQMGYDGPAPTGPEASNSGTGPNLVPEWDWPSSGPTPTILLEGGPEDWALRVTWDEKVKAKFDALGVFAEPYASYALCLHTA